MFNVLLLVEPTIVEWNTWFPSLCGLSISGSNVVIENCIARNNNSGRGLYIQGSNNAVVNNYRLTTKIVNLGLKLRFLRSGTPPLPL